jgi:hypothetical protein
MAEQRRRTTGSRPAPHRAARPRRRTGWLAPLLVVATGGLVAAAQLTPVLVDLTATSTTIPDGGATSGSGTGRPSPGLLSWSTGGTVAGDSNGATVINGGPVSGLVVPQPPRPNGIALQPWAAHGESPTLTPLQPVCGGLTSPKRMTPGVVAGPGSATVNWQADDRAGVTSYQVSAVGQRLVAGAQPPPVTVTAAQPTGCQQVTATVTGLTSGARYVFWLEEQITSPTTGVPRLEQVGTSSPVLIG